MEFHIDEDIKSSSLSPFKKENERAIYQGLLDICTSIL